MEVFSSDKRRRHDYFLKVMQKRSAQAKNLHRIILIGTGESGKSTFVKQMKLLSSYKQTFPDSYRLKFVPEIQRNLVQSLSSILAFMDQENISFKSDDPNLLIAKNLMYEVKNEIERSPDSISLYAASSDSNKRNQFYDSCSLLWSDKSVKETQLKGNEFQLIDCAQYFLDKINDVREINYKPTDDDILQSRTKTLGIHTESIVYNNVHFELVDVGGQREQRAKWIEAMSDGVTAVIFLTDVSAYDMMLAEDHSVNRLRESINLLGQVWTKSPLRDKSIILFLNKQDKLEKKVREQRTLFETFFPEYNIGKILFIVELLKDLKQARLNRSKKENDIWEKYFSYFLPNNPRLRRDSGRGSLSIDTSKTAARDSQILTEYNQIQNLISKAFNDNLINNWSLDEFNNKSDEMINNLNDHDEELLIKNLLAREDFNTFQRRLHSIAFYQVVSITDFIQKLFVSKCEQSTTRHVYPFPTTAIDKRNVDRIFDSCKDILQGKALTDLMV